jgi:hypothetical protein
MLLKMKIDAEKSDAWLEKLNLTKYLLGLFYAELDELKKDEFKVVEDKLGLALAHIHKVKILHKDSNEEIEYIKDYERLLKDDCS